MDWRFSTFLLALFLLLIVFSVAPVDTTLCDSKFVKDVLALENKDGAASCFDFWFNRYQGLISGVLSLLSALIAARLVWHQLVGMHAANEISRRAQAVSQYEAVQRRHKALTDAGTFGNKVQTIAKIADHLVGIIEYGQISDEAIEGYRRELIERCDIALADAIRLKTTLDCGPTYSKRIRAMEFDCDNVKGTVREFNYQDGDLLDVGSMKQFCWMLNSNAQLMMRNSLDYFRWHGDEIRRLERLMISLDQTIIGSS